MSFTSCLAIPEPYSHWISCKLALVTIPLLVPQTVFSSGLVHVSDLEIHLCLNVHGDLEHFQFYSFLECFN